MKQDEIDDLLGDATGLKAMALVAAEMAENDPDECGPVEFTLSARVNHRGELAISSVLESKKDIIGTGRGYTLQESLLSLAESAKFDCPASIERLLDEIMKRLEDGRMQPA